MGGVVWAMRLAVLAATAGLAAASLMTVLAGAGFPFELMSQLHPQWAAGALILGAVAMLLRMGLAAGGLLAIATLHAGVVGVSVTGAAPKPQAGAPVVTMVWANLQLSERALVGVARLARERDAALVALTELPRGARDSLPDLFPGACIDHPPYGSRLHVAFVLAGPCPPGVAPAQEDARATPWPNALRRIAPRPDSPAGAVFSRVVALHPPPPLTAGRRALRDRIIADAVALARPAEQALLVGDFNAAPWSPVMRRLSRQGLKRVDCGAPWRSTWFSRQIVLGLPIDAAYVRGDAAVRCRVGPPVGSDHYPLILEVAAAPAH